MRKKRKQQTSASAGDESETRTKGGARWGNELLAEQALNDHAVLLSVEKCPEVPEDVRVDVLGVVDGSLDLVEGGRVDERSSGNGTRLCRDKEGVDDDLSHLMNARKQPSASGIGKRKIGRGRRTNGDSRDGVLVEHLEEKVSRGSLDLLRHLKRSDLDLLEEDSDIVVVEGETAGEESEEDDSARPDVGRSSVVGLALQQRRVKRVSVRCSRP